MVAWTEGVAIRIVTRVSSGEMLKVKSMAFMINSLQTMKVKKKSKDLGPSNSNSIAVDRYVEDGKNRKFEEAESEELSFEYAP